MSDDPEVHVFFAGVAFVLIFVLLAFSIIGMSKKLDRLESLGASDCELVPELCEERT
jgi:Na+-transporting methylmalonyl-CoA/oxaloacetate decarboxylase gamma subunit